MSTSRRPGLPRRAADTLRWFVRIVVLSTMASIPSSRRVRGHPSCSVASRPGSTRRLFQVLVVSRCRRQVCNTAHPLPCSTAPRPPSTGRWPPLWPRLSRRHRLFRVCNHPAAKWHPRAPAHICRHALPALWPRAATAIAITVNSVAASFFISYVLCSKRSDPTSSSGRLQIGARTFLFVDLLRIGRVLDELVVAPWAFVASSCADCLFPKRIHGVNSWCSTAVSVNTCSGDRAPSGIQSWPAWAFPSWPPSSRTGGRPRLWSWSLPRCACASCCTGGGGSRLPPSAKKQHCSTQPSTSWTPPNMSSSSEKDPPRAAIEPPVAHPRTGP